MQKRARAIIVFGGKIILIKRIKKDSIYWVFPGGGVEKGENITEGLLREIKEEIGVEVKIKNLFKTHVFHSYVGDSKEYFYLCDIIGGKVGTGNGPEFQTDSDCEGSYVVELVDLSQIANMDVRPAVIRDFVYNMTLS